MRTEFLCISVLRVASGPRVKLASCKSALNPPVFVVALFVFLFFCMYCDASIVVTVFNSCPLCFLFYQLFCNASILVSINNCPFCFLF